MKSHAERIRPRRWPCIACSSLSGSGLHAWPGSTIDSQGRCKALSCGAGHNFSRMVWSQLLEKSSGFFSLLLSLSRSISPSHRSKLLQLFNLTSTVSNSNQFNVCSRSFIVSVVDLLPFASLVPMGSLNFWWKKSCITITWMKHNKNGNLLQGRPPSAISWVHPNMAVGHLPLACHHQPLSYSLLLLLIIHHKMYG